MMKRLFFFLCALLSVTKLPAQVSSEVEMADGLRASGMIYVVVVVIATIFIGLLFYLYTIDKRISKIEKIKSSKN